jgi:hypothetical protein
MLTMRQQPHSTFTSSSTLQVGTGLTATWPRQLLRWGDGACIRAYCASPLPPALPPSAGTLHYAVAYDRLFAPYGAYQLAFAALTPPSSAVVAADPAAFVGGLVANGSVAVAEAGSWLSVRVNPPCVGLLCRQSLHGLQGGTAYRIFLVAVDGYGVADPAPAVATVATAPASEAPALLPPSGPANITDSGFSMAVRTEAAGGAYYLLLAPKPGTSLPPAAADVPPGSWALLGSLTTGSSQRRLTSAGSTSAAALAGALLPQRRQLLAEAAEAVPGSLVAPTCYPTNQTCSQAPVAAFAGVAGLAAGFTTVAAGCAPVPAAGQPLALPTFTGLANNSLYFLLVATEDRGVPTPLRAAPPAVFAVRTVDLSAPRFACGFPVATNITSSGFSLSAMLTKPGASVFYVLLPSSAAATAPSALEVLQGTGAGGTTAASSGNLTRWGALPWEAAPAGIGSAAAAAADASKLWAPVAGLQSGVNYTAFLTLSIDGNAPVTGGPVAVVRWAGCAYGPALWALPWLLA